MHKGEIDNVFSKIVHSVNEMEVMFHSNYSRYNYHSHCPLTKENASNGMASYFAELLPYLSVFSTQWLKRLEEIRTP